MKKLKLSNEDLRSILVLAIILVIGVLFTCSVPLGTKGLSYLIGITFIVFGIINVINSIINKKKVFTEEGIIGSILIPFGVIFIMRDLATLVIDFIPWVMISVGFLIIIDAFLSKFLKKDASNAFFVIKLISGAIITTAGFLIKFVNGWLNFAGLVLGVILILYALLKILFIILKKPNEASTTIVIEKETEVVNESNATSEAIAEAKNEEASESTDEATSEAINENSTETKNA